MAEAPFALWLPPPPPVAARLQQLIERLAAEFGGVPFPPHMTLFGRVDLDPGEARRRTSRLVRQWADEPEPVVLHATGFGFHDAFYRALFLPIATPAPLWRAYRLASAIFAGVAEDLAPFLPHLSLAYTDAPIATRLAVVRQLAAEDGVPDVSFTVDRLCLIRAAGGPADWSVEAEFEL